MFDCISRCRIIVCPSSSRARLLFSELTAYTMCWDDSLRSEPASIDAQRLHSTRRASLSCRAAFPLLVRLSMSVPGRLLPLVEDVKPEDTACVPLRGSGTLPHRWKSRGTQAHRVRGSCANDQCHIFLATHTSRSVAYLSLLKPGRSEYSARCCVHP